MNVSSIKKWLMLLMIVDFIAYLPNFPFVHLETRPADIVSPLLMTIYYTAIFLPLLNIFFIWKSRKIGGIIALFCGLLNIIPSMLDMLTILFPYPPPKAILTDEIIIIGIGAIMVWLGFGVINKS